MTFKIGDRVSFRDGDQVGRVAIIRLFHNEWLAGTEVIDPPDFKGHNISDTLTGRNGWNVQLAHMSRVETHTDTADAANYYNALAGFWGDA
jgi:hypothetical protein